MASAGGRRVIIQHSHRLTATLQRPQPPPLFPPSPTSKSWSCFSNQETKTFLASQSSLSSFIFFKENCAFPLLEEAGALCLATIRLPTSRCARSIHPCSPARTGPGGAISVVSTNPSTQTDEGSWKRNSLSLAVIEAVFRSRTDPSN